MRKPYKKSVRKAFSFKKTKKRRKKNNHKNLIFSIIGILVFVALGGVGIKYFNPKLDTNTIEISGISEKSSINPEDLKKAAKETFGFSYSIMGTKIETENFLTSNQKKISSLMEKFPQIENIEVKKDSNGNIIFEIKEKSPFAIWCEDEKCSLVDTKGIFIKDYNAEEEFNVLPKIEKKEWFDASEYKAKIMEYVFKINQILNKNEHFKQQTYEIFSDKITLRGDSSCILIFDLNEDISWQLEKMEAILKKEEYINNLSNFEYIDLRFKNQIIVK
ncbi:MAG: hypothetical protein PHR47_02890 [Candidatus Pacebacteria bacterium]|nr:hypothetical protein [Candidatus Paceibacterota bacterium]